MLSGVADVAKKIGKGEVTKKKRRVVESEDEEVDTGDAEMKAVSQSEEVNPSKDSDASASPEPPKKRVKTGNDKPEDTSSQSAAKEIRQEIKETAKAQIDQIKEAPESIGTPTSMTPPSPSRPTTKPDVAKSSKPGPKNSTGKNPFSLAKAKTTSSKSESGNGKTAAAGASRKNKGKGKRDPDESEDDDKALPNDKSYQPGEEEEEHDSDGNAEVDEKDELEEEEEEVDDEEEEKSAKVAASKLYALQNLRIRILLLIGCFISQSGNFSCNVERQPDRKIGLEERRTVSSSFRSYVNDMFTDKQ